jgi:hypothetical protein
MRPARRMIVLATAQAWLICTSPRGPPGGHLAIRMFGEACALGAAEADFVAST